MWAQECVCYTLIRLCPVGYWLWHWDILSWKALLLTAWCFNARDICDNKTKNREPENWRSTEKVHRKGSGDQAGDEAGQSTRSGVWPKCRAEQEDASEGPSIEDGAVQEAGPQVGSGIRGTSPEVARSGDGYGGYITTSGQVASDGDEDPLEAGIYEWGWPPHGRRPTTGTIWSPVVVKETFWRPNRWSAVESETFRWLATKETVRWMSWKPLTKESFWLNLRLFRLGVKQHKSLGLRCWKLGLHSAHILLWLGLCRAHSLHWLGIWQLLLRLGIHQRLGTNEGHQLRHSLGGILHRLWIIHIIWSSTNYPVGLDLNILFLFGGECRKPLSTEPDYLTKELL